MGSFDVGSWISEFAAAKSMEEIYKLSLTFSDNLPDASTLISSLEVSPDTKKFTDTLATYIDTTSHTLLLIYDPAESAQIANVLINKNPVAAAAVTTPIFESFPQRAVQVVDNLIQKYPQNAVVLSDELSKVKPKEATQIIQQITTLKGIPYTTDLIAKVAEVDTNATENIASAVLQNNKPLGKDLFTKLIVEEKLPQTTTTVLTNILVNATGNNFAGYLGTGTYLTTGITLVYTTEFINALVNNTELPAILFVDWAPLGLPAQKPLRNLERTYFIFDNQNEHIYTFTNIHYHDSMVNGTGWICTWAASGIAPTTFA